MLPPLGETTLGNILKDGYNSPVKTRGAGSGFDRTAAAGRGAAPPVREAPGPGKHRKGYRDHSIIGRLPPVATHARDAAGQGLAEADVEGRIDYG